MLLIYHEKKKRKWKKANHFFHNIVENLHYDRVSDIITKHRDI